MPAQLIAIQAVYISTTDSGGSVTDRILGPVSTVDEAADLPKCQQPPPTTYCLNRQTTRQITLGPVPDNASTYRLNIRYVRQPQDGSIAGRLNVEIPYPFYDAFTVGLAARHAKYHHPELRALLKQDAMEAYGTAANQDQEESSVPSYLA